MNQITFTYEELRAMDKDDRLMILQLWGDLHPEAPIVFEEKLERLVPEPCPICTEPPEDAVDIGCGHVFCKECIRDWGQRGGANHDKCPMCRKPYMPIDHLSDQYHLRSILEQLNHCLRVYNSVEKWRTNLEDIRSRMDHHFKALKFQNTSAWDTYTASQCTLIGIRIRCGLPA